MKTVPRSGADSASLSSLANLPVALDAMGGDLGPLEMVAGAGDATRAHGIPVLLVGRSGDLGDTAGADVLACTEVIGMQEDPVRAVRQKKDSSGVRAAEAVRDRRACAFVSAGSTGAALAAATLRLGRIPGAVRPAVVAPLPVPGRVPHVLVDAGANVECPAGLLVQLARMGSVFSAVRYSVSSPRVALLSNGEESSKGTPEIREAHRQLLETPGINFIGNIEGREILDGDYDVVVTDGFTGNVVLKLLEGTLRFFMRSLLNAFGSSPEVQEAARVLLPALTPLADEMDPEATGGAMLLGVDGVCVISHGSSTRKAIMNAIRVAHEMVDLDLVARIKESIEPGHR